MTESHIEDLVGQLDDLRVTSLSRRFRATMTASGAEDLRSAVTPFGQRFDRYLQAGASK